MAQHETAATRDDHWFIARGLGALHGCDGGLVAVDGGRQS